MTNYTNTTADALDSGAETLLPLDYVPVIIIELKYEEVTTALVGQRQTRNHLEYYNQLAGSLVDDTYFADPVAEKELQSWEQLSAFIDSGNIRNYEQVRPTTVPDKATIQTILRAHSRAERVSRMTPERREIYNRIRQLREEIGPLDFDVVAALRELRENG